MPLSYQPDAPPHTETAIREYAGESEFPWPFEKLSCREKETALYMLQGHRYKEISHRMNTSAKTVDTHRRSIFRKLGIESIVHLTLLAVSVGLIEVPISAQRERPECLANREPGQSGV